MTAQEIDDIASAVVRKLFPLLKSVSNVHPCAWKMLMPYEQSCKNPGTRHSRVASLADGTPMESDWKQLWLCEEHYELINQHNGYEVEEA